MQIGRSEERSAEVPGSSSATRGLLSQALQAEPSAQAAEGAEPTQDEAATQDAGENGRTVVSTLAFIPATVTLCSCMRTL